MSGPTLRVGELRPSQLLHTYGVGAVADLPNLSVVISGLEDWELSNSVIVPEDRLLAALRVRLGPQVQALRTAPYKPETPDPFADWARVGVPVRLFPRWLRCSDTRCNRLAPVESGLFALETDPWRPERIRYAHGCRGHGRRRPAAVPSRFVLACPRGHLDDFPYLYFVHGGEWPQPGEHTLRLFERGSTGEATNLFVECSCSRQRPMAPAFGQEAVKTLPACRGRHPHLGTFEECGEQTRTLGLGATNGWFAMQVRAFRRSMRPGCAHRTRCAPIMTRVTGASCSARPATPACSLRRPRANAAITTSTARSWWTPSPGEAPGSWPNERAAPSRGPSSGHRLADRAVAGRPRSRMDPRAAFSQR